MKRIILGVAFLCMSITACSGDGNSTSASQSTQTPAQAIAALENNGTIPKLDRSSSIAGPDINENGIRDDIDTWIGKQAVTAPQKSSLNQHARVLQMVLVTDLTNPTAVAQVSQAMSRSVKCIFTQFSDTAAPTMSMTLEKITANTKERFLANMNFSKAASGSVISAPQGDTCEP